jgi:hypothetical protein
MRTFFGMILGSLLTIAFLYVHDATASSTVVNGSSTTQASQIVNWDVAAHEWTRVKDNAHTAWVKLTGTIG